MNGVLIIDKPEGFTSHDVVARLRRILDTKRIGHTGTLDPFATGVLVILVGKATRLARFLDKDEKAYEAKLRFGFETETGDRTGKEKGKRKKVKIKREEIEDVLPEFLGEIKQTPPMYSAKKIRGKKLYDLARQGVKVERKPVLVNIKKLEILRDVADETAKAQPSDTVSEISLQIACSAGTYIRTLAEDIGRKIGVGCHLTELQRTRAGKFEISKAVTLEELEEMTAANETHDLLIPMNDAVAHLPERKLTSAEVEAIGNGLKVDASFDKDGVQFVRLTDSVESLVAIGVYDHSESKIQPRIVFQNN